MLNEVAPVEIPRERDILDTLWRIFSSAQLAAVVLLVVALASVFGALFPQAPSQAMGNSAVYAQWLASVQDRYGGWFDFLDTVGLFNVYSSWWFRSLLALLAFSLIISTAERLTSLWLTMRQTEVKQGDDSFVDASEQAVFVEQPVEQLVERLKATLTRRLCRTLVDREEGVVYLYADRLWVEAVALLGHVGLIVVLAGVVVTDRLGWQEDAVALSPGQSYEIGHGLDAVLRFEKLELDTYLDGSPKDYRTWVQIIEEDGTEFEQVIGVNRPFTYRGVSFYQISHGMAVAVKASDQNGRPLLLQSFADGAKTAAVVSLPFGGHQSERHFAVPDQDLVFQLVFYQSLPDHGYDGPVFLVQAYQGSKIEPIYSRFVEKSDSLGVAGAIYHLALDQYSVLRIVRDPAVVVIALGLLLTVVGHFLWLCSLFWSPIWFWAAVSEKGDGTMVKLAGTAERDEAGFASWFEGLAREIEGESNGD